jgi:hypothetical protein
MRIFELKSPAWMPYALCKVEDAPYPEVWLPVNRDYERPEGMRWDYEANIDKALVFRGSPRTLVDCFIGDLEGRYLYLFDHTHDAVADYPDRLAALWALHPVAWEFYREKWKKELQ